MPPNHPLALPLSPPGMFALPTLPPALTNIPSASGWGKGPTEELGLAAPPPGSGVEVPPPHWHREAAREQHQLQHIPQAAEHRSGHTARAGPLSRAVPAQQPQGPQDLCQQRINAASSTCPGTFRTCWSWS